MDTLVRIKLRPLGVWSTPWQSDSILGALANTWARDEGPAAAVREFIEPWLDGEPQFVISDAFPGDSLPAPAGLTIWWRWPPESHKSVKKRTWLSEGDFRLIQAGERPDLTQSYEGLSFQDHVRLRNSISRLTDTTGEGGELFEVPYTTLTNGGDSQRHDDGIGDSVHYLTLYARATEIGLLILEEALQNLGRVGYGADASVGHGGFEMIGEPEPCPEFDEVPGADSFISLSTSQPAASDPVTGFWRLFVKYGKLAPEFHNIAIFKRPQVMLRAGACFRTHNEPGPYYGGPIPPDRLFSPRDQEALALSGIQPVQPAFALAVPMVWPRGD